MENKFKLLIFGGAFLLGCHNAKETAGSSVTISNGESEIVDTTSKNIGDGTVSMVLNYTGQVRDMSKEKGCGWMIALDAGNGNAEWLEPLTIDEKYKVDGKTIVFNFVAQKRPSRCTLPSKPIEITKYIE